jgi:dTMP kinase
MARGLFLSLDGLDGCGKSTQCRLLVDWLRAQGHRVTACREPGGTPLGEEIRRLLLEREQARSPVAEALLFMTSRAQLVDQVIKPALDDGQSVISDRFLLSTVVYQGYGSGLDPKLIWEVGWFAASGLEPDLTLVLDLPVDVARARITRPADRIETRDAGYYQRVREGFLSEAQQNPRHIRVLDARPAPEAVHASIVQEVSRVLEAHPRA